MNDLLVSLLLLLVLNEFSFYGKMLNNVRLNR